MPVWKENTVPEACHTHEVQPKKSFKELYVNESYPLQSEPPPRFGRAPVNGIFVLNDDCLIHIMSFLECSDFLNLRYVHNRFKFLFRLGSKSAFKKTISLLIQQEFLEEFPLATDSDVYEVWGEMTHDLIIDLKKEKDFLSLLKYFPNITTLEICNTELKTVGSIKNYPRVENLHLFTPNIPVHFVKKLFRHLDKSLVKLSYPLHYTMDLLMLHNLQEIRIPIDGIRRGLKVFLEKNPQCWHVEVYMSPKSTNSYDDWVTLSEASNVYYLHLEHLGAFDADMRRMATFYNLTTLELTLTNVSKGYYEMILEHMGPQLTWLIINNRMEDKSIKMNFLDHISHLEFLEVLTSDFQVYGEDEHIVAQVCQFEILTKLHLLIESPRATLQIIRLLERLTEMENDLVVVHDGDEFDMELSDILKETGRTLKYNRRMFPVEI